MRTLILAPIALLVFVSTQAAAQLQWAEFQDESEFFSVNFPGEPVVTEVPYASEYGATFPSRIYTVESGDYFYSVTVIDFTDAQQIYLELPDKTDEASSRWLWLYDQLGATASVARKFRERGGEVTFDAWNHIDFVEGHQLQITNPDSSRTFAGIYLHHARLYVLEATFLPTRYRKGYSSNQSHFWMKTASEFAMKFSPTAAASACRDSPAADRRV